MYIFLRFSTCQRLNDFIVTGKFCRNVSNFTDPINLNNINGHFPKVLWVQP